MPKKKAAKRVRPGRVDTVLSERGELRAIRDERLARLARLASNTHRSETTRRRRIEPRVSPRRRRPASSEASPRTKPSPPSARASPRARPSLERFDAIAAPSSLATPPSRTGRVRARKDERRATPRRRRRRRRRTPLPRTRRKPAPERARRRTLLRLRRPPPPAIARPPPASPSGRPPPPRPPLLHHAAPLRALRRPHGLPPLPPLVPPPRLLNAHLTGARPDRRARADGGTPLIAAPPARPTLAPPRPEARRRAQGAQRDEREHLRVVREARRGDVVRVVVQRVPHADARHGHQDERRERQAQCAERRGDERDAHRRGEARRGVLGREEVRDGSCAHPRQVGLEQDPIARARGGGSRSRGGDGVGERGSRRRPGRRSRRRRRTSPRTRGAARASAGT